MTTLTLLRPAPRPGALVAPQFDDRPCVTNPPQWWDLGDDGNAAAMWLCRKRCPLAENCAPQTGAIRQGIAWGGGDYTDNPKPLKVCPECGHPKVRHSSRAPMACKCPGSGRTREQIIQAWLDAGGDQRPISHVAPELGIHYQALKDTLRRARDDGDTRIPLLATLRERVAA